MREWRAEKDLDENLDLDLETRFGGGGGEDSGVAKQRQRKVIHQLKDLQLSASLLPLLIDLR